MSTHRAIDALRNNVPDVVHTVDYHTAGEPFRIVAGGIAEIPGRTVLERRAAAMQTHDALRAFLVNEPRGHADMYGGFVVPPDVSDTDPTDEDVHGRLGVVFFHKDGFSTACGHGTIALTKWALESGVIAREEPITLLTIDAPSGRLFVEADVAGGQVGEIRFTNVPSWVAETGIELRVDGHTVAADVSYGGAFYASVDVRQVGLSVAPQHLASLIRMGREIKWSLNEHRATQHPADPQLSGCYGTIWFEPLPDTADGDIAQRNVTVFADGEVDRSPCGSGTSARLALLHQQGVIGAGRPPSLRHEGIVGTSFRGRVLRTTHVNNRPAVITQVGGYAFRTGTHNFVLDPDDEVGLGFQLR